jgi:hypothetical protein
MFGFNKKEEAPSEEVEPVQPEEVLDSIDTDKDGKIEFTEAATFILRSRTIQVNAIALIAMLVQNKYGFVIDASLQSEILLVINMFLRTITTKPIKWSK